MGGEAAAVPSQRRGLHEGAFFNEANQDQATRALDRLRDTRLAGQLTSDEPLPQVPEFRRREQQEPGYHTAHDLERQRVR